MKHVSNDIEEDDDLDGEDCKQLNDNQKLTYHNWQYFEYLNKEKER